MPATERKNHPLFNRTNDQHRWTGKLADLMPELRKRAWAIGSKTGKAERAFDKDFAWVVLRGGAVVGLRVRDDLDMRHELRIARPDGAADAEVLAGWIDGEVATFLSHFGVTLLDGETPAEHDRCWVRTENERDAGKLAVRFLSLRKGEVTPGEPVPPVPAGGQDDAGGVVPGRGSDGPELRAARGGGGEEVHGGSAEADATEPAPLNDLPYVFFDCETTGTSPAKDRIVQISILEPPSGDTFSSFVNPGTPIPAEATAVHGISDDDVKDAPAFAEIAADVQARLARGILCTFNGLRFDVPLVDAELVRAGQPGLPKDQLGRITVPEIDLYQVWFRTEERNLVAAAKRFAGKDLTDAHDADADTLVLPDVLEGMADAFGFDSQDAEALVALTRPDDLVDRDGKFRKEPTTDGRFTVVYNFGPKKDQPVKSDLGLLEWMLRPDKDFSPETCAVARWLLNHYRQRNGGQTEMGV